MRQFNGPGGKIYALGESYKFQGVPLRDCGTGWDWRAPEDMFYWSDYGLRFEVRNGFVDHDVGAVELHHRSGRVGFNRCVSGMDVRVSGECRPTSLLGEGESWKLILEAVVKDATTLGSKAPKTQSKTIGSSAEVRGVELDPITEDVLVWLPAGDDGVFVGVGQARVLPGSVTVTFNHEGVTYGNR